MRDTDRDVLYREWTRGLGGGGGRFLCWGGSNETDRETFCVGDGPVGWKVGGGEKRDFCVGEGRGSSERQNV